MVTYAGSSLPPATEQAPATPTPADCNLQSRMVHNPSPLLPSLKHYYSRRWRPLLTADAAQDGSPVRATATCLSTPPNRRTPFLARMMKKTAKILPTPRAARLRSRALTPAAPPRRSRRIAGAAPETPNTNIPSRQKRKVMRALGIIGQAEGIDQRSLEEYSKLFTSSCALVSTHVQAMAALFGWATPDEEELAVLAASR